MLRKRIGRICALMNASDRLRASTSRKDKMKIDSSGSYRIVEVCSVEEERTISESKSELKGL